MIPNSAKEKMKRAPLQYLGHFKQNLVAAVMSGKNNIRTICVMGLGKEGSVSSSC